MEKPGLIHLTGGVTRSTDFFHAYVSNPVLFPRLHWKFPHFHCLGDASLSRIHVHANVETYIRDIFQGAIDRHQSKGPILYLWLRVSYLRRNFQAQFSAIKSGTLREGYGIEKGQK